MNFQITEDSDLRIKILRIKAKLSRSNRKECFRELFQWLVERRFNQAPPDTEEEWMQLLSREVSQQVYDIALSQNWIWEEQVRTYTTFMVYFHGPGVRATNERNRREAHRFPTFEEVRDRCWADLILEWQARFLQSKRCEAPTAGADVGSGSQADTPLKLTTREVGLERLIEGKTSVNVPTASHYLEVTADHVRRLVRTGKLGRVGRGRPIKISTRALKEYKSVPAA